MTGHVLAAVRGVAVAALDLNPGATSLAARRAPAVLGAGAAGRAGSRACRPAAAAGARLDVIADLPGTGAAQAGRK